jgi:hypothetical protein
MSLCAEAVVRGEEDRGVGMWKAVNVKRDVIPEWVKTGAPRGASPEIHVSARTTVQRWRTLVSIIWDR